MKAAPISPALRDSLPLLLAATLPLGVVGKLPLTSLLLGQVAAGALCLVALLLARRDRHCRPPFEYWWIAVPMVPLAAILAADGMSEAAGRYLAGIALFLAIVVTVQRKNLAADALFGFAIACGITAILNFLAQAGVLPPAAIDGELQVAVAVGRSLRDSVLLLFMGLLAGLYTLTRPAPDAWRRGIASVAVLAIAAWLATLSPHVPALIARWMPEPLNARLGPQALAVLLLLWIVARVAARSFLSAARPADGLLPALLLAGTLAHVGLGHLPGLSAFAALGFIAAHDAPWATVADTRVSRWVPLAIAACVGIQLAGVVPLAPQDPRNQLARGERVLRAERWHELDTTTKFMLARRPGHPGFALLRAQSLLRQGWPHAAVAQFVQAEFPAAPGAAQPQAQESPQEFLNHLRDTVSARDLNRRGLLFERALVHAGEIDSAMDSLAIRRDPAPRPYSGERAPLARAVAELLGRTELAGRFDDWDAAQLRALLENSGIAVETVPPGFPEGATPLITMAAVRPEALQIIVMRPNGSVFARSFSRADTGAANAAPLTWRSWEARPASGWGLRLLAGRDALATVLLDAAGDLHIEPGPGAVPSGELVTTTVYLP